MAVSVRAAAIAGLLAIIVAVGIVLLVSRDALRANRVIAHREVETRRAVKDLVRKHRDATLETRASVSTLRNQLETLRNELVVLRSDLGELERGPIAALMPMMERMESGPIRRLEQGIDEVRGSMHVLGGDVGKANSRLRRLEDLQETTRDIRTVSREIQREQLNSYRQLEAYIGLVTSLDLGVPLPQMRGTWALAPDTASFLVRKARELGSPHIVELGSGVSTALLGAAVAEQGGSVTSIEHLDRFADETRAVLAATGVEHLVDLVVAELGSVDIDGSVWQWYAPDLFDRLEQVDFVVVDGPPRSTGPSARYPALPILAPKLRPGSLIFLDDSARDEEGAIADRWFAEFPIEKVPVPKLEKGGALFEWRGET